MIIKIDEKNAKKLTIADLTLGDVFIVRDDNYSLLSKSVYVKIDNENVLMFHQERGNLTKVKYELPYVNVVRYQIKELFIVKDID